MAISAYIGALQAIQRKFHNIVVFLFHHARYVATKSFSKTSQAYIYNLYLFVFFEWFSKLLQIDKEDSYNTVLLKVIAEENDSWIVNNLHQNRYLLK